MVALSRIELGDEPGARIQASDDLLRRREYVNRSADVFVKPGVVNDQAKIAAFLDHKETWGAPFCGFGLWSDNFCQQ